jgi:hypothetical protein
VLFGQPGVRGILDITNSANDRAGWSASSNFFSILFKFSELNVFEIFIIKIEKFDKSAKAVIMTKMSEKVSPSTK